MSEMQQPKQIWFCWDFITPVNYNIILSSLVFPLPTFAWRLAALRNLSPREEGKKKGKRPKFPSPGNSHKSQYGMSCHRLPLGGVHTLYTAANNPVQTGSS